MTKYTVLRPRLIWEGVSGSASHDASSNTHICGLGSALDAGREGHHRGDDEVDAAGRVLVLSDDSEPAGVVLNRGVADVPRPVRVTGMGQPPVENLPEPVRWAGVIALRRLRERLNR